MLKRQTTGSVVCPNCGRLVGVLDEECFNCGRANPGMWGYAPWLNKLGSDLGFTQIILVGCITLYVVTLLVDLDGMRSGGLLSLFSPSGKALAMFGMSGTVPVLGWGRWWTVLSAAWLHGGLLHIFFNMMWIRQLAPAAAELYGVGRLVIIYTASAICGFGLTTLTGLLAVLPGFPNALVGAAYTVGASAPLFGLFGAIHYYGRRTGNSRASQYGVQFLVIWVVIGFMVPIIDNWAHIGGFAGGYLAARWLDPLKSEQPQHLLIALICLALHALSIVASVLHSL